MDVSAGPRYPECPAGCGANDCARIVGAGGRIGPRRSVLSSRHPFRVPIEILTQNSSSRLRDFMAKPRMPHSPPGRKDAKNREEIFARGVPSQGSFWFSARWTDCRVTKNTLPTRAFAALRELIQSGRPLIYICTTEETRAHQILKDASRELFRTEVPFWTWSVTAGLCR